MNRKKQIRIVWIIIVVVGVIGMILFTVAPALTL